MVSVFCPVCSTKLSQLRKDAGTDKTSTRHPSVENWAWCSKCKSPVEIIAKGVSK